MTGGDDLVEIPENALIEERIAFGLTAPQLGILAAAGALAALINLVPLWPVVKVPLVVVVAGPLALAAVLSIRGEPAYRWLLRGIAFWRSSKTWEARVTFGAESADKPLVSGAGDTEDLAPTVPAVTTIGADGVGAVQQGADNHDIAARLAPDEVDGPGDEEHGVGDDKLIQLPVGGLDLSDLDSDPADDDAPRSDLPYVLPLPRLVCLLSFAGGVGKTTLAVELATYLAATARYRTADDQEQPVNVLLLDAARLAPAAGLRLGLSARVLAEAWRWLDRGDPRAVASAIRAVSSHLSLLTLAPDPAFLTAEPGPRTEAQFTAREANALIEAGRRSGAVLLIADLGTRLEVGHVRLIEQAELTIGVVRPTVESLPDVYRLSEWLRRLGVGRKLAFAANLCSDEREVTSIAREVDVPLLAAIAHSATLASAGERGEPGWRRDQGLAAELARLASALWPMPPPAPRQAGLRLGRIGSMLRRSG